MLYSKVDNVLVAFHFTVGDFQAISRRLLGRGLTEQELNDVWRLYEVSPGDYLSALSSGLESVFNKLGIK